MAEYTGFIVLKNNEHIYILLHVHPLLGNEFPRGQILGKQSVARLRNNK
jgi:hypothetical protein